MTSAADITRKVGRHIPERTCIACGKKAPISQLVRTVHTKGEVMVDTARRAEGRGAYVCVDSGCLAASVERRLFNKAFKCNVNVDSLRVALFRNTDNCLRQSKNECDMRTP
jgi:predicted RNA-binding protein YlxR (DUF448 family)